MKGGLTQQDEVFHRLKRYDEVNDRAERELRDARFARCPVITRTW